MQYEINPFLASRDYRFNLGDRVVGAGDIVDGEDDDVDLAATVFAYGRRVPQWTPYEAPTPATRDAAYLDGLTRPELQTVAASIGVATTGKRAAIIKAILATDG